jgi:hypothetical protein
MVLAFTPRPLPADKQPYAPDVPGVGSRVTLLWFLERDPQEVWDRFAGGGEQVAASGLGTLVFSSPFVPTLPGTDTYVDELR